MEFGRTVASYSGFEGGVRGHLSRFLEGVLGVGCEAESFQGDLMMGSTLSGTESPRVCGVCSDRVMVLCLPPTRKTESNLTSVNDRIRTRSISLKHPSHKTCHSSQYSHPRTSGTF